MEYILAGIGLIAGVALGWLYAHSKALSRGKEIEKELEVSREKLSMSEAESSESHRKLYEERAIVSDLNQKLAVAGEKERPCRKV